MQSPGISCRLGTAPGKISWQIKLLPAFWHGSRNTLGTSLSRDQKITLMPIAGSRTDCFFYPASRLDQGTGIKSKPRAPLAFYREPANIHVLVQACMDFVAMYIVS